MKKEISILQQDTPDQGELQVNVTSTIGIQPITNAIIRIFSGRNAGGRTDDRHFRSDTDD